MKYKVKVGTLHFEQGTFNQGDIIEVTEERAALFDKLDVEALPEPKIVPVVEVKPAVVSKKKTVKPVVVEEAPKTLEPTETAPTPETLKATVADETEAVVV